MSDHPDVPRCVVDAAVAHLTGSELARHYPHTPADLRTDASNLAAAVLEAWLDRQAIVTHPAPPTVTLPDLTPVDA